jgi:heat shock protein HslJ
MTRAIGRYSAVLCAVAVLCWTGWPASAQAPPATKSDLAGTSWRLVRIQISGGKPLVPSDETAYTIDFQVDGRLRARIDCNGGRARWTSLEPGAIQFGTLGLTQEKCKPGSLHDRIVKDWRSIRSYAIQSNNLLLFAKPGDATYEFRPLPPKEPVTVSVASTGPITFNCTQGGKSSGTLQATFYQTEPAMVLVEREGRTRPAFSVPAASGAKYDAKELVFAEARGQASVIWSGVTLECRRR